MPMSTHPSVAHLYEQLARLAKSVANPHRLVLIELLCQSPRSVDALAEQAGIALNLASSHLKELRMANLVRSEKRGRQVIYHLASPHVAGLLVVMRAIAADRLLELQDALRKLHGSSEPWTRTDGPTLLRKARNGQVTVLDVRPADEYANRHLPHARNIPIQELSKRIRELPKGRPVVAYCRGPYCLWSGEAVILLQKAGFEAYHWNEGPSDWIAGEGAGLAGASISALGSR
jgi:rhodanese-related sulfurtransferase/DNA-binding transcriptional ArsR family regulator